MLSEQKMKNIIKKKATELAIDPQLYLTEERVKEVTDFLCHSDSDGNQYFELVKINPIREAFEYDGYNVKLTFINGRIRIPVDIDMTTGELLLPVTPVQQLPLLFEEGHVTIASYPIEQILADKLYTTLSYGKIDDQNTRTKDLYDLYFLNKLGTAIDPKKVRLAMEQTMIQRQAPIATTDYQSIITSLEASEYQAILWEKYAVANSYARSLSFLEVMNVLTSFSETISKTSLSVKDKLYLATIKTKQQHSHIEPQKQLPKEK